MKTKKLDFIEQHLDIKPTENYWRGITVLCNGIRIFDIEFDPKESKFDDEDHFYIRNKFFPEPIFDGKLNPINIKGIYNEDGRRIIYYDKEEVKKGAQIAFETILNLFI